MKGITVTATPPERRSPYLIKPNESSPGFYEWSCAVCAIRIQVPGGTPDAKEECQEKARAHRCSPSWSALPIVQMSSKAGVVFGVLNYEATNERPGGVLPTKDDRVRWRDRYLRRIGARRA